MTHFRDDRFDDRRDDRQPMHQGDLYRDQGGSGEQVDLRPESYRDQAGRGYEGRLGGQIQGYLGQDDRSGTDRFGGQSQGGMQGQYGMGRQSDGQLRQQGYGQQGQSGMARSGDLYEQPSSRQFGSYGAQGGMRAFSGTGQMGGGQSGHDSYRQDSYRQDQSRQDQGFMGGRDRDQPGLAYGRQDGSLGQQSRGGWSNDQGQMASDRSSGHLWGQGAGYSGLGLGGGMGGSMGSQPSYRGRGPKGYTRSDDRIKEAVSDALEDHHDLDASEIEVQVQSGEVTLTGTVADRRQKRLAEDCLEGLRGVKDIHNQLRVHAQLGQGNQSTRPQSLQGQGNQTQGSQDGTDAAASTHRS